MGLCLGLGNDIKDTVRDFARAVAEGAGVDDGLYLGGVAMFVVVVVGVVMFVIVRVVMIMLMMVVMVVLVMMVVMLMIVMMVVVMVVLMMVVMVMLVLMLVTIEVAVEPLHVVVVPIVLGIKHHIKVAGVERRDVLATHLDFKAAHSKAAQCLAEALLACAGIQECANYHVSADATRAIEVERPSHMWLLPACIARSL